MGRPGASWGPKGKKSVAKYKNKGAHGAKKGVYVTGW
tara:strand:- start:344 stop:454 length:111 start_codon:yes stop_codon:yes gene_type:complete